MPTQASPCPFPVCTSVFRQPSDLARHLSTSHRDQPLPVDQRPLTLAQQLWWDGVLARQQRHLLDNSDEEDALGEDAPRYTITRYPSAAWPCTSEGQFLDDHEAPAVGAEEDEVDLEYFGPFETMSELEWGSFVTDVGMSEAETDRLLDLVEKATGERPFASKRALVSMLDEMEEGAEWRKWEKCTLTVDASDLGLPADSPALDFLSKPVTFYKRDTRLVLLHLLGDRRLSGQQQLVPVKVEDQQRGRWVGEPCTGDEAWAFQETLPEGFCGVRIDSAQDATICSTATGGAQEHPVYLTTPVVPGHLRRGAGKGRDELYRAYKRVLRHKAMEIIMLPLKVLIQKGELVRYADGHWRWTKAYFGPTAVDYPESCWLNALLEGWCPCCHARPDELLKGAGRPRSTAEADLLRAEALSKGSRTAAVAHVRQHGLHLEKPWYSSFGINGHSLITADLLHQLIKGTIKDLALDRLLIPYLESITGGGKQFAAIVSHLSQHLALMPVFKGLRRFPGGIEFSQWTGNDTRALAVILPSALYNLTGQDPGKRGATVVDKAPQLFALLAIFLRLARSYESTDQDRHMMMRALENTHFIIDEDDLFDTSAAALSKRFHSLDHYVTNIILHGVSTHSDTSTGERLHKATVKDPYRQSNHLHPTEQILRNNSRRDALHLLVTRTSAAPSLPVVPSIHPVHSIYMPSRGTSHRRKRRAISSLAQHYSLPALPHLLCTYLSQQYGTLLSPTDAASLPAYSFNSITAEVPTYPVPPPFNTADSCSSERFKIYANMRYTYRSVKDLQAPRFDPILLCNGRPLGLGWPAVEVARVRLLFSFPLQGQQVQLAMVEMYSRESAGAASHG